MKIHRVLFSNLNSLRGSFDIDFVNGPLGEAGIFAITGPTGAGKSTMLDAITLGLFGQVARYRENTHDPREMMSRGCGEASAEVHFEDRRGVRYRSVWCCNRARKKADGKFQAAKRYVYNALDEEIATGVTKCNEIVEELISLDVDRFFRSAMLAQGEFSRFLRAKTDERAELLESLTSTEIYSDLGVLAYQRYTSEADRIKLKRATVESIQLLTDEQIEELQNEIRGFATEIETLDTQAAVSERCVARKKRLAELAEEIKKRQTSLTQVKENLQKAAPVQNALQLHAAADRYRTDLIAVDQATDHLSNLTNAMKTKANDAQTVGRLLRSFITTNTTRLKDAATKLGCEIEELAKTRDELNEKIDVMSIWLNDNASEASIEKVLIDVSQPFAELQHLFIEHARLILEQSNNKAKLEESRRDLAAQVHALDNLVDSSRAIKLAYEQVYQQRDQLLHGVSLKELNGERENLRNQIMRQEMIHEIILQTTSTVAEREELAESARQLTADIAKIQTQISELDVRLAAARELKSLRENLVQQATLIQSLDEHRRQLIEGKSCPLCGALEHPFAAHIDAAVSDGDRLRSELEAMNAQVDKLLQTQHECAIKRTAMSERLSVVSEQMNVCEQRLVMAAERLAELNTDVQIQPENIEAKIAALNGELHTLEETHKSASELEEAVAERVREMADADNQIKLVELQTTQLRDKMNACEELAKVLVLKEQSLTHSIGRQKEHLCASLRQFFSGSDIELDDSTMIESIRAALINRLNVFRENCRLRDAHSKSCEQRNASLRLLEAELSAISAFVAELEPVDWELRDIPVSQMEEEVAATQSIDELRIEFSRLRDEFRLASMRREESAKQVQTAELAVHQRNEELAAKLSISQFSNVELLRQAILSEDQRAQLQSEVDQLNSLVSEHEISMRDRQREYDTLFQDGVSNVETLEELVANHTGIVERRVELLEMRAAAAERLASDNRCRQRQRDQIAEIEEDMLRLRTLEWMRELIGCSSGKKFRTFAQGLVLDHLVRHANRHLLRFSTRYELLRPDVSTLDIQICDRLQANAIRPTESLSGGEGFLVSLALALGLSELSGSNMQLKSLFIDEGFGTLDPDTLDIAIAALESLRGDDKSIGVISHVEMLKERITTQILVERLPSGCSKLRIVY